VFVFLVSSGSTFPASFLSMINNELIISGPQIKEDSKLDIAKYQF
jgi:hypothetical protein